METSLGPTQAVFTMRSNVEVLKEKLCGQVGSCFGDILSESMILAALDEAQVSYRHRVFTPLLTLWAFLYQVLDADKSLANAVKQIGC
ncbi:MAG TPA: hypothetical protein V6D29_20710 [Leptolyngbyaceae cyanobacterium]